MIVDRGTPVFKFCRQLFFQTLFTLTKKKKNSIFRSLTMTEPTEPVDTSIDTPNVGGDEGGEAKKKTHLTNDQRMAVLHALLARSDGKKLRHDPELH